MSFLMMLAATLASFWLLACSIRRMTDQEALEASQLPFADEPDYKPQILFEA